MVDEWQKNIWINGSGINVEYKEIVKHILGNLDFEIHVGTDSQQVKDVYVFATVICLYVPGNGGTYYVSRHKESLKKYNALGYRLQRETDLSISIAEMLKANLISRDITVHADLNPDPRHKSSKHLKALKNFVLSMGYKCIVKPDSWAAFVADKHAK